MKNLLVAILLLLAGKLAAQISRVKDINDQEDPAVSSYIFYKTGAGDKVYFYARTGEYNNGLGVSDGTENGTHVIYKVEVMNWSTTDYFVAVGNTVYFTGRTQNEGVELWKTDGTEAGTVLVKDIIPGFDSGYPA